jgi:hypothetical protein
VRRYHLYLILGIFLSLVLTITVPLALIIRPFLPYANYLLGVDKKINYLILLGNDTEMRANGGFAGSYAKITLDNSPQKPISSLEKIGLSINSKFDADLDFQDIYVPNGQLEGHVAPPTPIQQAFGHGTWELANADWEPDFPTAAAAIRWFLEKGDEINPDILAIVNLSTIKKILNIVGPFPVSEYSATITPDNLYLFLQGKSEVGFFPGSTQKKDTLLTVGKAFTKKANSLSFIKKIKIAHLLYSDLVNQNIVVNSSNQSFQDLLNQKNFSGVLKPASFDHYSLIETNLGANKANAYVTRQTAHIITATISGQINHQAKVTFHNSSSEANPNPPFHYGGNYIAYLRFYIPTIATDIQVHQDGPPPTAIVANPPMSGGQVTENLPLIPHVNSKYGFTEIGFWHTTAAGTTSTVNLSYNLSLLNTKEYTLTILKQHGMVSSPQEVSLFGKIYSLPLHQDFFIKSN